MGEAGPPKSLSDDASADTGRSVDTPVERSSEKRRSDQSKSRMMSKLKELLDLKKEDDGVIDTDDSFDRAVGELL